MSNFFYPLFRNRPVPNYVEIEQSSRSAKLFGLHEDPRCRPAFDFGISGLSEALICNNKG